MAITVDVRIKNLPEIKRAFAKSPILMKRNLGIGIRQSVAMIERRSRINTPVDTGRLRASHRSRFTPLSGEISVNTDYAIYVHEGTSRMRARPFLRRAVEQSDKQIQLFMKEAVDNTIRGITRTL